jgi:ribosomal protein S18 acetylase RimI-like enzyme
MPAFRDSSFRFYRYALPARFETTAPDGFRIIRATLLHFLVCAVTGRPKLSWSRAFRRGDVYFLARRGSRIVASSRICFADTREVKLGPDEAALISFHTEPEYRGRGLYVALMREMLRYLTRRQFTAAYIWADRDNAPSIRGIEKAGFTPLRDPAAP